MPNLGAFLSYIVLTAFTPGPNNIMVMSVASKRGFKKGFPFCLGVILGFFLVMIVCTAFSAALFDFIPQIEPFMKYVGAAYILWLAWTIYRDKPHEKKKSRFEADSMFSGVMLQFVNVKVILYGITAMTTFILPYYKSIPSLALFIAVLTLTGFASVCCWALFGSAFQKVFTAHKKILNIVMALLLVYCAVTTVIH